MSLGEVDKLTDTIGELKSRQDDLSQQISPDESENQTQLGVNQRFKLTGEVRMVKKYFESDAFIVDHIVQGYVDGLGKTHTFYTLDNSLTSNDGQDSTMVVNGTTFTTDAITGDYSLYFNGTSDYATIPVTDSFQGSTNYGVSFWFKSKTLSTTNRVIIDIASHGVLVYETSTTVRINFNGTMVNLGSINTDWNYISFIIVGSTMYLNYNGTASQHTVTPLSLSGNILLGTWTVPITFPWEGNIANFATHNSSVESTDRDYWYNSGSGTTLAAYKLDGGYLEEGGTPALPAVFPWTFSTSEDEEIYNTEF